MKFDTPKRLGATPIARIVATATSRGIPNRRHGGSHNGFSWEPLRRPIRRASRRAQKRALNCRPQVRGSLSMPVRLLKSIADTAVSSSVMLRPNSATS